MARLRPRDLAATAAVAMGVLLVLVPVPALVLDLLLATNLVLAALTLLVALRADGTLAAFPKWLLLGVFFRTVVSVALARRIVVDGTGGAVAAAFGKLTTGGDWAAGLVVLVLLATAHGVVVAKGAERAAEVGARFVLDALPAKHLALEADLRSGTLDAAGAWKARQALEREAQFFGAMDGALRFVKGEVVAVLVFVAVTGLGGIFVDVFRRGRELAQAVGHIGTLVVGAGVALEVSSMLMAFAAAVVSVGRAQHVTVGPRVVSWRIEVGRDLRAFPVAALVEELRGRMEQDVGITLEEPEVLESVGRRLVLLIGGIPAVVVDLPEPQVREVRESFERGLYRHAECFLRLSHVQLLVEGLEPALRAAVPKTVPLGLLAGVLRRLVAERIAIRDLGAIVEALVEAGERDEAKAAEEVRRRLRRWITWRLTGGAAALAVVMLDPSLEDLVRRGVQRSGELVLAPAAARDFVEVVLRALEGARNKEGESVLLVAGDVRRAVRTLIEMEAPDVFVVCAAELLPDVRLQPVGWASPGL